MSALPKSPEDDGSFARRVVGRDRLPPPIGPCVVAASVAFALGLFAIDGERPAKSPGIDGGAPDATGSDSVAPNAVSATAVDSARETASVARVRLVSEPDRSEIWNGAERACTTPCEITLLERATTLRAQRAGYEDVLRSIAPPFPEELEFRLRRRARPSPRVEETALPPLRGR